MDSVTHIIVGATAGYLLGGKKYGKRAMIWGAVGGSLPDMDVISNLWLDPVDSLMAHRGITHSFLFLALMPIVLSWLTTEFYKRNFQNRRNMRFFIASFLIVLAGITGLVMNFLLLNFDWLFLVLSLPLSVWGGISLVRLFRDYVLGPDFQLSPDARTLWMVFFVSMASHLFLDFCTIYGTGLLEPFTSKRFAMGNISVVDIFFTIPASVLILLACATPKTVFYNRLNLAWMVVYFSLSFVNYRYMSAVFRQTFEANNTEVSRMMISPAVMNNFLWYAVVETDTTFVTSDHSVFDSASRQKKLNVLPKDHHLLPDDANGKDLETLRAFSQGYYNLCTDSQGDIQWNDLRFGMFGDAPRKAEDYIFKFKLKNEKRSWTGHQARDMNKSLAELWPSYWKRVWGE